MSLNLSCDWPACSPSAVIEGDRDRRAFLRQRVPGKPPADRDGEERNDPDDRHASSSCVRLDRPRGSVAFTHGTPSLNGHSGYRRAARIWRCKNLMCSWSCRFDIGQHVPKRRVQRACLINNASRTRRPPLHQRPHRRRQRHKDRSFRRSSRRDRPSHHRPSRRSGWLRTKIRRLLMRCQQRPWDLTRTLSPIA